MKRTFQPSNRKEEISTVSEIEWNLQMAVEYWLVEGLKGRKRLTVSDEPRHKR